MQVYLVWHNIMSRNNQRQTLLIKERNPANVMCFPMRLTSLNKLMRMFRVPGDIHEQCHHVYLKNFAPKFLSTFSRKCYIKQC